MIPIVEDYLSEVLRNSFSLLQENPEKVASMLHMSAKKLQDLCQYLKRKPILIKRGYPRTIAELPCVCILLSNESETQEGLGDVGYGETDDYPNTVQESCRIGYANGLPYIQVKNKPIEEILNVQDDFGNDLTKCCFISNAHKGIVDIAMDIHGQDTTSLNIDYSYIPSINLDLSSMFEVNYRIEVWTDNGDLTVQLYHIVKAILLINRPSLITSGLYRQKLSGSDFQPVPSFFPSFVYRRALTFWAQCSNSVPESSDLYIQDIVSHLGKESDLHE